MNGGTLNETPRGFLRAFRTQASKHYSWVFWPNGGAQATTVEGHCTISDVNETSEKIKRASGILIGFKFKLNRVACTVRLRMHKNSKFSKLLYY